MKDTSLKGALLAAAALALYPAAALAQDDVKEKAEEIAEQANAVQAQAGELANTVAATTAEGERADEGNEAGTDVGDDARRDGDGDGDGGKWGLLGLLGLAGLLGLRRRDNRVDTDIRRDRL